MKNLNQLKLKIEELRNYLKKNTYMDVVITFAYPVRIKYYVVREPDMFDEIDDEPALRPAPSITFEMGDKLSVIAENDIEINEETFSKLKKYAKDIHFLYLNAFRARVPDLPELLLYHREYDDVAMG